MEDIDLSAKTYQVVVALQLTHLPKSASAYWANAQYARLAVYPCEQPKDQDHHELETSGIPASLFAVKHMTMDWKDAD